MHIIVLGLACLSVQFLAKYVGITGKKVVYEMVGLGGLFFLLTAASGLEFGGPDLAHSMIGYIGTLSPIMGWLCLLVGTLMGLLDMVTHHERLLPH